MLRGILTVGVWTLASRILGFARDMLVAAMMGAGPVADAFFVALKLPNLFRRLFGEGAFNAAFVPAFAATLAGDGPAAARQLAERMASLMAIWLTGLTVLGLVFMPQVLAVLAPGFGDDPLRWTYAVEMTRITFPYLLFICLTALVSGVLNGLGRFGAAAAAPVLFNVFAMAALLGLTPHVSTPGHAQSWGVMLSGIAQLALVWIAAARAGMPLYPRLPRLDPGVRAVLRRMVPGVLGAGVTQLNLAVDVIIASLLPAGAVSYLYYADRVAQLPLGVVGAAVGTALLPLLARQFRARQPLSAHRTLNRALEFSLALTLPAAVAQWIAADAIVTALFQRGAFGAEAARATADALAAYSLGLPAFVLVKAFAPCFFARGDTATPVRIGIGVVVLNLLLNLLLTQFLAHVGIALATGIAAWVNVAVLAMLLHRRGAWRADRRLRQALPRMLLANLLMAAVVWAAELALFRTGWLPGGRLASLALLIMAGMGTYFGAAHWLGALDLRELRRLRRRRAGPAAAQP
ncbi:murein biosynthesis integral membrane protein MurJ [Roseomonas sp. OT10]|uniref:murein biosynthesis integral membrane protein MurJ n=1 Tax=Roseomonas cutis TaxID=2897332 RepID=UPI001E5DAEB0|nr:murein biosynthesis integral membrane protein MurJ [Roseomonas sp. OT10]UFN49472.1 murein biosynthesis integral membrane protein MurJ [Roseomonas sp. OT10]